MKVEYNVDNLVIYLKNKEKIDDEELCNDIISKLDKYYNIKLKGFYEVNLYKDSNYVVIEFIEDNVDVSEYYSKADLHIRNISTKFLYCIEDILDIDTNYFYLHEDKYYIFYDDVNIKNIEFGNIIYKNVEDILYLGNKIDV